MSNTIFLDMTAIASTVIKHPTDVVWPHLLDQAAWMKDFKAVETIGGHPRQEGELKKVTPFSAEYEPFFFRTLLVVPFRRLVHKAYTENRSGKYAFTGIEVLSLDDLGRDSTVVFEAYLEFQSWTMTREQLADYVSAAREGSKVLWERNFQRLASVISAARTV